MPDEQTMNSVLSTYGINLSSNAFSWPNLLGGFIFGIIGFYAFNHGRKEKNYKPLVIGLALMIFPYFVSHTLLLYGVGALLTSLLYFWKD